MTAFIGQLPPSARVGQLPSDGPSTVVAFDRTGKERRRQSLNEILKQATPK